MIMCVSAFYQTLQILIFKIFQETRFTMWSDISM